MGFSVPWRGSKVAQAGRAVWGWVMPRFGSVFFQGQLGRDDVRKWIRRVCWVKPIVQSHSLATLVLPLSLRLLSLSRSSHKRWFMPPHTRGVYSDCVNKTSPALSFGSQPPNSSLVKQDYGTLLAQRQAALARSCCQIALFLTWKHFFSNCRFVYMRVVLVLNTTMLNLRGGLPPSVRLWMWLF